MIITKASRRLFADCDVDETASIIYEKIGSSRYTDKNDVCFILEVESVIMSVILTSGVSFKYLWMQDKMQRINMVVESLKLFYSASTDVDVSDIEDFSTHAPMWLLLMKDMSEKTFQDPMLCIRKIINPNVNLVMNINTSSLLFKMSACRQLGCDVYYKETDLVMNFLQNLIGSMDQCTHAPARQSPDHVFFVFDSYTCVVHIFQFNASEKKFYRVSSRAPTGDSDHQTYVVESVDFSVVQKLLSSCNLVCTMETECE